MSRLLCPLGIGFPSAFGVRAVGPQNLAGHCRQKKFYFRCRKLEGDYVFVKSEFWSECWLDYPGSKNVYIVAWIRVHLAWRVSLSFVTILFFCRRTQFSFVLSPCDVHVLCFDVKCARSLAVISHCGDYIDFNRFSSITHKICKSSYWNLRMS